MIDTPVPTEPMRPLSESDLLNALVEEYQSFDDCDMFAYGGREAIRGVAERMGLLDKLKKAAQT